MSKILVVTTAPIFPMNSGYKNSVLGRIDEYVELGHDVVVVQIIMESERNNTDNLVPDKLSGLSFYDVYPSKRTFKKEILSLMTTKTRFEQLYEDVLLRESIERIIDTERPDIVTAESLWALNALPLNSNFVLTCIFHDVVRNFFWEMYKSQPLSLKKIIFLNDAIKIFSREKKLLSRNKINEYIFLTKEDRDWYISNFNFDKKLCKLASNHLLVNKIQREPNYKKPFILIPGSIEFSQNYYGLKWFVKDIYPFINKKIDIFVTGRASVERVHMISADGNFHFTGELNGAQFNKLSSSCICVLAPIITGTGIKIKILEAVQKGIPVITTKFASKGIESALCIYGDKDTDESFITKINDFLNENVKE
ncbi:glycosyltransferase [Buttiauxella sp. 3AFRM03]|uniref:glycosyltransferase n=1 Tax=Buttiauxella sp. 3AFRM03 TaxID=2479367 RepID=UPI000EF7F463|nr:glycosyltransferase [Buttiauxella sp. 3AFRM03]AYN29775.1 glycosyltransferase [Buttiauxella sp. 3AFRM03]